MSSFTTQVDNKMAKLDFLSQQEWIEEGIKSNLLMLIKLTPRTLQLTNWEIKLLNQMAPHFLFLFWAYIKYQ